MDKIHKLGHFVDASHEAGTASLTVRGPNTALRGSRWGKVNWPASVHTLDTKYKESGTGKAAGLMSHHAVHELWIGLLIYRKVVF